MELEDLHLNNINCLTDTDGTKEELKRVPITDMPLLDISDLSLASQKVKSTELSSLEQSFGIPSEIRELLLSLSFFKSGAESEGFIEELCKAVTVRTNSPGDIIIKQGDLAKAMFFIVKGTLMVISDDGEINFGELGAGSYVGEIGIVFNVKRTATVVVKNKCMLLALTAENAKNVLERFPVIKRGFSEAARDRINAIMIAYEKQGKKMETGLDKQITELSALLSPSLINNQEPNRSNLVVEQPQINIQLQDEAPSDESESEDYIETPPNAGRLLGRKLEEKRRASVAIWSDDKLLKFAEKITQYTATREKHIFKQAIMAKNCALATSTKKESICSDTRLLSLNTNILNRILNSLSIQDLYKFRSVNKFCYEFLLENNELLHVVDIGTKNKRLDNKNLAAMLTYCKSNVKVLILRNCWAINDIGLQSVKPLSGLIILDLSNLWEITDQGLKIIAEYCTLLMAIDLSNCMKISDIGAEALLNSLNYLQTISFSYCKNLTEKSLALVKMADLKHLDLQRCTSIYDVGFRNWINPNFPSFILEDLNLSDCSFLTDLAIDAIGKKCPQIKRLCLSFCCALTEKCLVSLTRGCPFIETLDLSYCGALVTDIAADGISTGFPKLRQLSLRGCVQLTDKGVASLALNAVRLETVNLTQCKNVSPNIKTELNLRWEMVFHSIYSFDFNKKTDKLWQQFVKEH